MSLGRGAAGIVWFWCQAAPMSLKPEDGQHSDYMLCDHAAHFTVGRYRLAPDAAGTAPVNTVGTRDTGYIITTASPSPSATDTSPPPTPTVWL